MSMIRRPYSEKRGYVSRIGNAIQEKVRRLNRHQQQQVIAFVEGLESEQLKPNRRRFSFVGIAHSGSGSLLTDADLPINCVERDR